jgi:hypothetical protein
MRTEDSQDINPETAVLNAGMTWLYTEDVFAANSFTVLRDGNFNRSTYFHGKGASKHPWHLNRLDTEHRG